MTTKNLQDKIGDMHVIKLIKLFSTDQLVTSLWGAPYQTQGLCGCCHFLLAAARSL